MSQKNDHNHDSKETLFQRWKTALAKEGVSLPEAVEGDAWTSPLGLAEIQGVAEEPLLKAASQVLGVPFVKDLNEQPASAIFVKEIPIAFARRHCMLGMAGEGENLPVVIGTPRSWAQLDVISRFLKRTVSPIFAPVSAINTAINVAYQQRTGQTEELLESLESDDLLKAVEQLGSHEDLLDVAGRAPVIQMVNLVLFDAVRSRASDVHVQPYADRVVIRMRIDGVLFDALTLPKGMQEEIISRIKVIGKMNIAEKRLPQDGRATVQMGDRLIDLRIASLPSSHGERIVLRLLDKSARLYSLEELGMNSESLVKFQEAISLEHGLILVTGPTGSGKSTTLYAALQEINTTDRNVLTLEDPIEYQLDGVSQTQINEKKGMTFASGLRSVLRQDPDIVMIGEIRDKETAVMAIQASLTGHLVFSTLHTNDASSAITRLLDLGIEPYLVASSVMMVLAQRLVRRICPDCIEAFGSSREELQRLGADAEYLVDKKLYRGVGCETCRNTGYRERLGVFELLPVNEKVRDGIQKRENATTIREIAQSNGMKLLRDDGIERILSGQTTIEEVIRVTTRAAM